MSKKNVPSDLTKTALFKERSPGFGVTNFCVGVLTLLLLLVWPHILFLNPLYLSFLKCKIEMRILHNVDMNMKKRSMHEILNRVCDRLWALNS